MSKKETKIGSFIGSALVPDPNPIATPAKAMVQPGLAEQVRQLYRSEALAAAAAASGMETPEEGDDFDVGEDYEPDSPYEVDLDGVETDDTELDSRLDASIRRVFQGFGIELPRDGDPNPASRHSEGGEGDPPGGPPQASNNNDEPVKD